MLNKLNDIYYIDCSMSSRKYFSFDHSSIIYNCCSEEDAESMVEGERGEIMYVKCVFL